MRYNVEQLRAIAACQRRAANLFMDVGQEPEAYRAATIYLRLERLIDEAEASDA